MKQRKISSTRKNGEVGKAMLLLLLGLPPILGAMILPDSIYDMREELGWRQRRDPYEYLERWPNGMHTRQALAEIDTAQRSAGFISRLISSPYGEDYKHGWQTLKAVWTPDGSQVITGSASTATRWNAATGDPVQVYGKSRRRDAPDPGKWGFGFGEVAIYQRGAGMVAMTSGPHSLWFFPPAGREPLLLDGHGFEGLTAKGDRVAVIKNLEFGIVLDVITGKLTQLPHPDVNTIGLTDDGAAVTASRERVLWWRNGSMQKEVPIAATYNPREISSDGRWALVLVGQSVELWSTHTGEKLKLDHEREATAACAHGDTVVTATDDGHAHLWSAVDGKPIRSFRANANKIDLLACAPTRLLTVGSERSDARVWDLQGRPQSGPDYHPAPPRVSWIARIGADYDFPGRWPRLADWLADAAQTDLKWWAVGALVMLLVAAQWIARSAR